MFFFCGIPNVKLKVRLFLFVFLSLNTSSRKNKINFILTLDIVSFPKSSYCFSALNAERDESGICELIKKGIPRLCLKLFLQLRR